MGMAWDGSMMYLIDNASDALYTVRQIQAPSTTLRGEESYLPNAGDLYYNGGNFADAFMRWDNPRWTKVENCDTTTETRDTDCSTYEHDIEIDGNWFQRFPTVPGVREICTTWSDLPLFYDDCPTAGIAERQGKKTLSFGTFKANLIEAGREYYGAWTLHHQNSSTQSTPITLFGQEGEYHRYCPTIPTIWCIFGIVDHQAERATTTWNRGTSRYVHYPSRE